MAKEVVPPPLPPEALDAIEAHAAAGITGDGPDDYVEPGARTAIRLVAEVRRQRALFVRLSDIARTRTCPICETSVPQGHADDCPWPQIEREASA